MSARVRAAGASGYRFVCELARGGMGRVDLVVRSDDDFVRLYAQKRVLGGLDGDADIRAMFRDEARIAGMLRHPNVVAVHDVGEDGEGLYLLMDYVEGVPLSKLIRGAGDRMPVQVCLRIVQQVAEGLHAAHELRGLDGASLHLVHRDVSPSNVMVELNGVVRVLDFGIAKAMGRRAKTSTGLLKGKVGYLAPEVLRFEKVDRRADLFSLGVVLHEALTGERLYPTDDVTEVARRIMNEPAPDLGAIRNDVPDALVELCFELLAKSPDHRPATAREVADRIGEILRDVLSVEDPISLEDYVREHVDHGMLAQRRALAEETRRAPLPSERTRRRVLLASAVVLVVVVASAVGLALSGDEERPARAAAAAARPSSTAIEAVPSAETTAVPPPAPVVDTTEPEPAVAAERRDTRRRSRTPRRRRAATATMDTAAPQGEALRPWEWE